MSSVFVDFKVVKAAVNFEKLLERYKIDGLQKNGDELVGRCPIHQGDGQRAFHVSLKKNVFNCFSCKARGNVLDFVAAMEKCSVRDAAIKLQNWFGVTATEEGTQAEKKTARVPSADDKPESEELAANKPLTFQLKGIDHAHPYLAGRGVSKETAAEFGIGYFGGKGSMSGRIVIPIHNERGELVAYAGRVVDDSEPKYKLPPGFHKSLELYNLHRSAKMSPETVVLVEGYFGCLHLEKLGLPAVALMGSSISVAQIDLLEQRFEVVTVLMDGDKAGREAADEIVRRLARRVLVCCIDLPDGKQPDDMTLEELEDLFI